MTNTYTWKAVCDGKQVEIDPDDIAHVRYLHESPISKVSLFYTKKPGECINRSFDNPEVIEKGVFPLGGRDDEKCRLALATLHLANGVRVDCTCENPKKKDQCKITADCSGSNVAIDPSDLIDLEQYFKRPVDQVSLYYSINGKPCGRPFDIDDRSVIQSGELSINSDETQNVKIRGVLLHMGERQKVYCLCHHEEPDVSVEAAFNYAKEAVGKASSAYRTTVVPAIKAAFQKFL